MTEEPRPDREQWVQEEADFLELNGPDQFPSGYFRFLAEEKYDERWPWRTLAIRLPDGSLITDPDWKTVGDVMRSAHGQGVTRMPGELIDLDTGEVIT